MQRSSVTVGVPSAASTPPPRRARNISSTAPWLTFCVSGVFLLMFLFSFAYYLPSMEAGLHSDNEAPSPRQFQDTNPLRNSENHEIDARPIVNNRNASPPPLGIIGIAPVVDETSGLLSTSVNPVSGTLTTKKMPHHASKDSDVVLNPLVSSWGRGLRIELTQGLGYNLPLGDRISLDRAIPDVRPEGCARRAAARDLSALPTTSVVIVEYNEAASTLLRTVMSVLNRSPKHLLKEIIVVDDCSDWLVNDTIREVPRVRVLRSETREGLMRARMRGFAAATADTVTYLDSHVECGEDWLPPLLERVAANETTIVSPVIDIIDAGTFAYTAAIGPHRGVFDWDLIFKWKHQLEEHSADEPFPSPAHAGGLFTISRRWFEKLGLYDPGMQTWGFENLELSLRGWMCGGRLEIHPCSRVGHIFRKDLPSKPAGKSLLRNKLRTAMVWMENYAKFVVQGFSSTYWGDISERVELKQRLRCKSMQWYLDTVFPDHGEPTFPTNFENVAIGLCLDTMQEARDGLVVGFDICNPEMGKGQRFGITARSEIRAVSGDSSDFCLLPQESSDRVVLGACKGSHAEWAMTQTGELRHVTTDQCLVAQGMGNELEPKLRPCSERTLDEAEEFQWNWRCGANYSRPALVDTKPTKLCGGMESVLDSLH